MTLRTRRWTFPIMWLQCLLACSVYDADLTAGTQSAARHVEPALSACPSAGCEAELAAAVAPESALGVHLGVAGAPGPQLIESADSCPHDPAKTAPGVCGCGNSDSDSDGDATADCDDACPADAAKTAPGVCGCGMPETDSDADGTPDCLDGCPNDAASTSQRTCSCAEDHDADGVPDCRDACPQDATKREPGVCGCGQSDPADASAGPLYCSRALLRHRYSFERSDERAADSIGMADATLYNATQTGASARFTGDRGRGYRMESYAALPNTVWDTTASITLEAWITWQPSGDASRDQWQRVFDFGQRAGYATSDYVFVTPLGRGGVRAALQLGGREVNVTAPQPMPAKRPVHLACVLDKDESTLALYVDGALQGVTKLPGELSRLRLDELWLGRSHYEGDPELCGELLELRIWAGALRADQVHTSAQLGPRYAFTP